MTAVELLVSKIWKTEPLEHEKEVFLSKKSFIYLVKFKNKKI